MCFETKRSTVNLVPDIFLVFKYGRLESDFKQIEKKMFVIF